MIRLNDLVKLLVVFVVAGLVGCVSPYLQAGQDYFGRGRLALAVEYFDAGLAGDEGNADLRSALVMANQSYQWRLRADVERLKRSGRCLLALPALGVLEDVARRASSLGLPAEELADIERERQQLIDGAVRELADDFDKRGGRGRAEVSDLAACRQLLALGVTDTFVERRCQQLLVAFKYFAALRVAPGSQLVTADLFPKLVHEVRSRNPELFEVVATSHPSLNARMEIYLGDVSQVDTGWVLDNRDAYRSWIPRRDKKGRQMVVEVRVPPTKQAIEKAKKEGKERPKDKKVKKKLWKQVRGEYRYYQATRRALMPYRVDLIDLRTDAVVVSFSGMMNGSASSKYHEYSGHPRARKSISNAGPEGRHRARALPDIDHLMAGELATVPGQMATSLVEHVE